MILFLSKHAAEQEKHDGEMIVKVVGGYMLVDIAEYKRTNKK